MAFLSVILSLFKCFYWYQVFSTHFGILHFNIRIFQQVFSPFAEEVVPKLTINLKMEGTFSWPVSIVLFLCLAL